MLRSLLLASAVALAAGAFVSCGDAAPKIELSAAAARGKTVYLQKAMPKCGTCHVLREAGTKGVLGPNLDTSKFPRDRILKAVTQGVGNMPSQRELLTEQQIADVATYVAEVAGR